MIRRYLLSVLVAAFCLLSVAPAVRAAPAVIGILPLAAPSKVTAEIEPALAREVTKRLPAPSRRLRVLGPRAIGKRLSARAGVAKELKAARGLLDKAKREALYMRRGVAVSLCRQAITRLRAVEARYHAARVLAGAHGMLALALLLMPADSEGAREAFRAAVQVDPRFSPDADRMNPRARQLLAAARSTRRTAPAPDELSRLATRVGVTNVAWVAVTANKASPASFADLEVVVYAASSGTGSAATARVPWRLTHLRRKKVPRGQLLVETASLVARALGLGRAASRPAVAGGTPPDKIPAGSGHAGDGTRWYKRWWVWTIVGAVTATAAGVGLGLALRDGDSSKKSPPTPSGFDFEFTHP